MTMNEISISPNFFQLLRTSNLRTSTYKVALSLPEVIQKNPGYPISFQGVYQQFVGYMSQSTFRRSFKELEMLCIIAPTGTKSQYYFYNPNLIWVNEPNEFDRKIWRRMIEQRLQGQE